MDGVTQLTQSQRIHLLVYYLNTSCILADLTYTSCLGNCAAQLHLTGTAENRIAGNYLDIYHDNQFPDSPSG
jgi:hypothetical protein